MLQPRAGPIVRGAWIVAALAVSPALAEWTQWGGPTRDFNAPDVKLAERWPADGPARLWQRPLGEGYSGIVCDAEQLYTMLRRGDEEVVVALRKSDGKTLWERTYPAPLPQDADTNFGRGPNATPLLAGERLITVGFNGHLLCLNRADGEVLWTCELRDELGGTPLPFGYSSSPMRHADTVVVPVGGDQQALAAIQLSDGALRWKSQSYKNTYCTPLPIRVDGLDTLVVLMSAQAVGIDPLSGQLRFELPLKNEWDTHVGALTCADDLLVISSFQDTYGVKLRREGERATAELAWSVHSGIDHTTTIRMDGHLYGTFGSSRAPVFAALDAATGKFAWKERKVGIANLLRAGDKLLALNEEGVLFLLRASPSGLTVLAEAPILEARAWTAPALDGKTLFARDQKMIVALFLP